MRPRPARRRTQREVVRRTTTTSSAFSARLCLAPRDQARQAVSWFAGAPSDRFRGGALHHPLTGMIGGPMTGKVWGGTDAARDFSEAGVDIVISGHVHAPFALPYPFADERTYAIGCGTLSVRERGVPAGFNIIEVDDREIRVRAQAWSGSHFEAYRTWSLDRRR